MWSILILLAALLIRLLCLPETGFFCDVPSQLKAIDSGSFIIQFPGYAPYHLLIGLLARITPSIWHALLLFSFFSGMASLCYVMQAARELGGERAAHISGGIMAVSVLPVYFSVAGASYATDMLMTSGLLYHGLKWIRGDALRSRHYFLCLFWLCMGILMRPLSAIWAAPALLLPSLRERDVRGLAISLACLAAAGSLFVLLSLPFYGSLHGFRAASSSISGQLKNLSLQDMATNLFRVCLYPAYGLHVWLAVCVGEAIRHRKRAWRRECLFAAWLGVPFFLLLLRYIPHAGYYCLLLPVLAVFPWTLTTPATCLCSRRGGLWVSVFLGISLVQLFLLHPVPTRSLGSAVANAYFLQYSRTGLKQAYFETLSSAMFKAGGALRQQVPPNRQDEILKTQRLTLPEHPDILTP